MSTSRRGAFIVIEGLDRSGKSTQAAVLTKKLQQLSQAKLLKFPDRTTSIGKMIDAYLRSQAELDDRAIHLLFSANRWELASVIEKDLAAGVTIVCDRYAFSGVAFSAAKPSLTFKWCTSPDIGLPEPDLVLFLDVSPAVARSRGGYGEERYEKEEMQRRVRDIFKRIEDEAKQSKDKHGMDWVTIDAHKTLAEVEHTIWEMVEPLSKGVSGPVGRLWDNRAL